MKVGDYVRTKDGRISIIEDIDRNGLYILKDYDYSYKNDWLIKSSPNIIDLIEVGDYINGLKIISMEKLENEDIYVGFENKTYYQYVKSWNYESRINDYKIKSIVTKEQFESMEYKVGE